MKCSVGGHADPLTAPKAAYLFTKCSSMNAICAADGAQRSAQKQMPIPNAIVAVAAAEKGRDYLLNLEHPDGGSNAIWFHSLGYTRDRWQLLADDLLTIARNCGQFDTEITAFGVKYKAAGSVGRPNYRPGAVLTVWIVEDDKPPRLVTAYPDDLK